RQQMKIKICIILFSMSALVLGSACRKPAANRATANPNSSAADTGGGAAQTGEKFFFRGSISNTMSIEMILVRDRDRLTGNYFYPKIGKNIALVGTVDKDGNVALTESDDTGKQTGLFKGKWKPAEDSPDPSLNDI